MGKRELALERFLASEQFKRFEAEVEREEAQASDRKSWAVELRELRETRESRLAPLREEVREAERAVEAAQAELREALAWRSQAENALSFELFRHDSRTEELQVKLRRTAPADLRDKLADLKFQKEILLNQSLPGDAIPDVPQALGYSWADIERMRREKGDSYKERVDAIADLDRQIEQATAEMHKGE